MPVYEAGHASLALLKAITNGARFLIGLRRIAGFQAQLGLRYVRVGSFVLPV